jgi:hypothetical protein
MEMALLCNPKMLWLAHRLMPGRPSHSLKPAKTSRHIRWLRHNAQQQTGTSTISMTRKPRNAETRVVTRLSPMILCTAPHGAQIGQARHVVCEKLFIP